MMIINQLYSTTRQVSEQDIDHNNHMHDAYYNVIFSEVINDFNYAHGLSLAQRDSLQYTLFTLEEHTSYLSEVSLDEHITITLYIYDYDHKRLHLFLTMSKQDGTLAATNEVMMMGIDQRTRRSANFPTSYLTQIEQYYQSQPTMSWPKQLGHQIGIPKKEQF
ncbi:thioesterase family protein [Staphylococcus simiae]|uniref:Thioesterase n=1 Tax=Staphylococcus simiae CCM 7213 = CCUG 51256 TaxID=911238 RepID=G5JL99_9STAP|nr:thioesterase family protein [Staphylococcus simiae]EHJ07037.1 hypothetical protein SS7213T_11330 [Staphylococcus simiae CCM 7213 = CCUG 51256]PNZ14020.1 3-hydroxyacyl-CoA dehydrogenase [Staphylococcus simiae]